MEALRQPDMTEEEFLAREETSELKCEFLGGAVYAMSGASDPHNQIAMNLYGMLYNRLRGRQCQPFGPDMKVRIVPTENNPPYYYYPDAMIACDPTDAGHGWRERPAALFEILSESTRRVDEREKHAIYHLLKSLEAYGRIEQKRPEVAFEYLTREGWQIERITGLDSVVCLPSLAIELPVAELYERVVFPT